MGGTNHSEVEARFSRIRQKLDSGGYLESFGLDSLRLVEHLFGDLVKTTESLQKTLVEYSQYKKLAEELESGVAPFKEENVRLHRENSQLRIGLVKAIEEAEDKARDPNFCLRDFEAVNNDLKLLVAQFTERIKRAEADSLEKTKRIIKLQEKELGPIVLVKGKGEAGKKSPAISQQKPTMEVDSFVHDACPHCVRLRNFVEYGTKTERNPKAIDYMKLADSRIEALQLQLRSFKNLEKDHMSLISSLKSRVDTRETEIEKLRDLIVVRPGRDNKVNAALPSNRTEYSDLHTKLKSAEMQLTVLQRRNIELEEKLKKSILQEHQDYMLGKTPSFYSEGNVARVFLEKELDKYPSHDKMSLLEKLYYLERQLSHCCKEKAVLKLQIEECKLNHTVEGTNNQPVAPTIKQQHQRQVHRPGILRASSFANSPHRVRTAKLIGRPEGVRKVPGHLGKNVSGNSRVHDRGNRGDQPIDTCGNGRQSPASLTSENEEISVENDEFIDNVDEQHLSDESGESELEDERKMISSRNQSSSAGPVHVHKRNKTSMMLYKTTHKGAAKTDEEQACTEDSGKRGRKPISSRSGATKLRVKQTRSTAESSKRATVKDNVEENRQCESPVSAEYSNGDVDVHSDGDISENYDDNENANREPRKESYFGGVKDSLQKTQTRSSQYGRPIPPSTSTVQGRIPKNSQSFKPATTAPTKNFERLVSQRSVPLSRDDSKSDLTRKRPSVTVPKQVLPVRPPGKFQKGNVISKGLAPNKIASQSAKTKGLDDRPLEDVEELGDTESILEQTRHMQQVEKQERDSAVPELKKRVRELNSESTATGKMLNNSALRSDGSFRRGATSIERDKEEMRAENDEFIENVDDKYVTYISDEGESELEDEPKMISSSNRSSSKGSVYVHKTNKTAIAKTSDEQKLTEDSGKRGTKAISSRSGGAKVRVNQQTRATAQSSNRATVKDNVEENRQCESPVSAEYSNGDDDISENYDDNGNTYSVIRKESYFEGVKDSLRKDQTRSSQYGRLIPPSTSTAQGRIPKSSQSFKSAATALTKNFEKPVDEWPVPLSRDDCKSDLTGKRPSVTVPQQVLPIGRPGKFQKGNVISKSLSPNKIASQSAKMKGHDDGPLEDVEEEQEDFGEIGDTGFKNGNNLERSKHMQRAEKQELDLGVAELKRVRERNSESTSKMLMNSALDSDGSFRRGVSRMEMEREIVNLQTALASLDRGKGEMRAELDMKDKGMARLRDEASKYVDEISQLKLRLKNAEVQLKYPAGYTPTGTSESKFGQRENVGDSNANFRSDSNLAYGTFHEVPSSVKSVGVNTENYPSNLPWTENRDASLENKSLRDKISSLQKKLDDTHGESSGHQLKTFELQGELERTKHMLLVEKQERDAVVAELKRVRELNNESTARMLMNSALGSDGSFRRGTTPMEMEREIVNLRTALTSLDRDKDEMRVELDMKDEGMARLRDEASKYGDEISQLKLRLKNAELQINHTGESAKEQFREVEFLKKQLESNVRDLEKTIRQRDDALKDLHRLTAVNTKGQMERRSVESELEMKNKEVDALRKQVQRYIDEVRRIEELLFDKEEELETLIQHYRALTQENNNLEAQRTSLEREASSIREGVRDAVDQNIGFKTQMASQNALIQSLEQEIESLTQQVCQLENQAETRLEKEKMLESEVKASKDLIYRLEVQMDKLKLDLADSESKRKQLEAESSELNAHIASLEARLNDETDQQQQLENLLANSREKDFQMERTTQGISRERDELAEKLTSLQQRSESLNTEVSRYRLKSIELQSELDRTRRQLDNEKRDRETAIGELKRAREQLNTSSANYLLSAALGTSGSSGSQFGMNITDSSAQHATTTPSSSSTFKQNLYSTDILQRGSSREQSPFATATSPAGNPFDLHLDPPIATSTSRREEQEEPGSTSLNDSKNKGTFRARGDGEFEDWKSPPK